MKLNLPNKLTLLRMAMVPFLMVFITFDELLPLAEEYGEHHLVIHGLIAGMLVMAASLAF